VIVLVAVILAAVAVFGTGAARVALSDLAQLETQEAVQRAAEAAAAAAADLLVGGALLADIDPQTQREASDVAAANVTRGSVRSVTATSTSSSTDLVRVTVSLTTGYGGFAGPLTLTASGAAAVPRGP